MSQQIRKQKKTLKKEKSNIHYLMKKVNHLSAACFKDSCPKVTSRDQIDSGRPNHTQKAMKRKSNRNMKETMIRKQHE